MKTSMNILIGILTALIVIRPAYSIETCAISSYTPTDKDLRLYDAGERYKTFKAFGTRVGAFTKAASVALDAANGAMQAKLVENSLNLLRLEVLDHLRWTGQPAGVIEIVYQHQPGKSNSTQFLRSNFVGSGSCGYNAIVESLGRDVVNVAPSFGFVVDPGKSYYIVLQKEADGKFVEKILFPGWRGPLLNRAYADAETQRLLKQSKVQRELEQLQALAAETIRLEKDEAIRKQVREAISERNRAFAEELAIEKNLQDALHRLERSRGALVWFHNLQAALALADLAVQVKALLGPATPKSTLDQIDSVKDPASLGKILESIETAHVSEFQTISGNHKVLIQKVDAIRTTILQGAKQHGAPHTATRLP